MNVSYYLFKGIFKVATLVFGYKRVAKVVGLSVGKKIARYGAEYVLGGFLPIRIVKQAVAVAPYAPAAFVLATGGTAGLAINASYIVISQLSDYLFVCAVRRATITGAKVTFKVLKYVFITKPLGLDGAMAPVNKAAGDMIKEAMNSNDINDDDWVVIEDENPEASKGAIHHLLVTLQKNSAKENGGGNGVEITEEMVQQSLAHAEKVALEINEENIEFEEEVVFEGSEEEEGDVVYEEVDMPTTENNSSLPSSMHAQDDEFVLV